MKAVGIEELVRWAYGQELPKLDRREGDGMPAMSGSSSWAMVAEILMLGTVIDRSRAAPSMQMAEPELPHPDALAVHAAVLDTAGAVLAMPEGFDALGDVQGLTDAERVEAHRDGFDIAALKGGRIAALVIRRGKVGDMPPWRDHGPIARRPLTGPQGQRQWFRMVNAAEPGRPAQPKEVDGFDRRRRRPYPGAYERFYLDPAPSLLVAERIEYQAWVLALGLVSDALTGRLAAHRVLPPSVPLWPWDGEGEREGPRILLAHPVEGSHQEAKSAA